MWKGLVVLIAFILGPWALVGVVICAVVTYLEWPLRPAIAAASFFSRSPYCWFSAGVLCLTEARVRLLGWLIYGLVCFWVVALVAYALFLR